MSLFQIRIISFTSGGVLVFVFFGAVFGGVFCGDCVSGITVISFDSLSVSVSEPDETEIIGLFRFGAVHVRLLWPFFPQILHVLRFILL